MFTKIFVVISLMSLCSYLIGILYLIKYSDKNVCRMTYMFEYPQFVKINFDANKYYPKYNLFAYSEGRLTENARNSHFNGAPVIFVPGNSGSYKQARSLASVALRKGIDNDMMQHLDYFTIDFNEEYTALYGGYFNDQTKYLAECIRAVLKLYERLPNKPQSVVIVAHSMGGKIVQSVLTHKDISDVVKTVIMIATPVDKPVLHIDFYFEALYRNVDRFWTENKIVTNQITNCTNACTERNSIESIVQSNSSKLLNDLLLITIGGGSRDLLIHAGLTTSKFSDVHVISTAIPNVWLTTDHLCSVWCLQQILVINRFLYSIMEPSKGRHSQSQGQRFIDDKPTKLQLAKHYFVQEKVKIEPLEISLIKSPDNDDSVGDWIEDSRRVFSEQFKNGLKRPRYQMIRLTDNSHMEILDVEAIGIETDNWVFGCAAIEIYKQMRYCSKATSLNAYAKKVPSQLYSRFQLSMNLHNISRENPNWTHILLRMLPTIKPFQLNIDIHNEQDRELTIRVPKWYSFSSVDVISDTLLNSLSYTIKIIGMDESFKALELMVQPKMCSKPKHHAIAQLCVPWGKGSEFYHHFTDTNTTPMAIYVPTSKPLGYNSTINSIQIRLNLDPSCRYKISIKNEMGLTLARMVQQFSHWLPAHFLAILLLALKHQISLTPSNEPFKCGSLQIALVKASSFFIVTASKVFAKLILWTNVSPQPDAYEHSLLISILIHGSSLAILMLLTNALWFTICVFGKVFHEFLLRIVKLPNTTLSGFIVPAIQKFPMAISVLLLSMSVASCGGLALICAVCIYFILITKMYEDFLEETTISFVKKCFGFGGSTTDNTEREDLANNIIENCDKSTEDDAKVVEVQSIDKDDNEENIEMSEEERLADEQLNKLLREAFEKQKERELDKLQKLAEQREEYDGVNDAISNANFHLTLFILLVLLTGLNLPSVISWAKNYRYSSTLENDPSFIPAVTTILSMSFLWQFKTPGNVIGYNVVGSIFYMLSAGCILYCQESMFRLNAIICTVFILLSLHQILTPFVTVTSEEKDTEKLDEKIERLKEELKKSETAVAEENTPN